MDGFMNDGSFAFKNEENKAAYDQALRQSAKDVIYMYLNASEKPGVCRRNG